MDVVGIFILPPSKKELVNRLKNRGRDTKSEMKKRMNLVQNEISHFPEYDYVVVNKDINICVKQIKNIIESERLKRSRLNNLTNFVDKFGNLIGIKSWAKTTFLVLENIGDSGIGDRKNSGLSFFSNFGTSN